MFQLILFLVNLKVLKVKDNKLKGKPTPTPLLLVFLAKKSRTVRNGKSLKKSGSLSRVQLLWI